MNTADKDTLNKLRELRERLFDGWAVLLRAMDEVEARYYEAHPVVQEVRMLTDAECQEILETSSDDSDWECVQRKFCEVNGLKLASVTTKEK